MNIIDSHVHLWDIRQLHYPWLSDVDAINKTFLIGDYQTATKAYNISAIVFVQCECLPEEALKELQFVAGQYEEDSRIQAIVAYAPLEKGRQVETYLQELKKNPLVKAVRRMTGSDPGLSVTPDFLQAVQLLAEYDLSLDLSIQPYQVDETINLVQQCPDTTFILDHLGKPAIAKNGLPVFKNDMKRFADLPNVVAKISGLITEADHQKWQPTDIRPYIQDAVHRFGFDRLLFGSDWPVLLMATGYQQWMDTLSQSVKEYAAEDLIKLFYSNAKKIYRI